MKHISKGWNMELSTHSLFSLLLNSKLKIKCDLGIFPDISTSHILKISGGTLTFRGGVIPPGNMPTINPGPILLPVWRYNNWRRCFVCCLYSLYMALDGYHQCAWRHHTWRQITWLTRILRRRFLRVTKALFWRGLPLFIRVCIINSNPGTQGGHIPNAT